MICYTDEGIKKDTKYSLEISIFALTSHMIFFYKKFERNMKVPDKPVVSWHVKKLTKKKPIGDKGVLNFSI